MIPRIARRGIDRRWRHDLIIGDVTIFENEMMGQPAAPRAPESDTDIRPSFWDFERCRNLCLPVFEKIEAFKPIVHRNRSVKSDAVSAGAVALECIPHLGN